MHFKLILIIIMTELKKIAVVGEGSESLMVANALATHEALGSKCIVYLI